MSKRTHSPLLLACLSIMFLAAACASTPPPAAAPTVTAPAAATAMPSNAITDIVWQWTSVKNRSTNETTTVATPEKYTITFRKDGTLSGKADCNNFTGTYTQQRGLTITLGASTTAACPKGSADQQYLQLLRAVVAGGPDGQGGLALETPGGEQRMEFRNSGAALVPERDPVARPGPTGEAGRHGVKPAVETAFQTISTKPGSRL